jgi:hypothetical protein
MARLDLLHRQAPGELAVQTKNRVTHVAFATGFRTMMAAAVIVVLAGCAPQAAPATTAPAPAPTTAAPTATAAVVPAYVSGGTAAVNKAFFDIVNNQTVTGTGASPEGPAFITALRTAGFPADVMEVTQDITTVGVKADSIQFSVKMPDACLVGQWGAVVGYVSIAAPILSTGKCLVGQTRTIDF